MKKLFFLTSILLVGLCNLTGNSSLIAKEGQHRPSVLSRSQHRLLADEVNGYAAFNNLRMISTYHRTNGSDQTHEVLTRLKKKCQLYGIKSLEMHKIPVHTGLEYFGLQHFNGQVPTRTRLAEVRLVKPYPKLITTSESAPSCLLQGSRAADITAPVVYIGNGADPKNYEGKDLKGKIVLAGNALPGDIRELAIHTHKAAGILWYFDLPHNSGDNDDAVLDFNWTPWSKSGEPSTFGISLSNNQCRFLKKLLDDDQEVVVKIKIDTELKQGEDSVFEILDAAIRGTDYPEDEFWVWAHIDHPLPGAVDNGSGCAVVLEMARALQALIDNGIIPQPKRTIRFLWVPHVTGLYMYLTRFPEKIGNVHGGISLDSVGIDQSVFSSYFAPCKPSHSLPSFWTAVLESLVEHLGYRTNRDLLDYRNTDNLFAPEGSRDQYNIRLLPYNAGGDEMQSNNNTVRIPTMAFGCIPVPPRHSQVNFLKYIDPTGLHRVAYIGCELAMVFGWADSGNIHNITNEVFKKGRLHLLSEYNKAHSALHEADTDDISQVHVQGQQLLTYGGERELGMLSSVEKLMPGEKNLIDRLEHRKKQIRDFAAKLSKELDTEFNMLCQKLSSRPGSAPLTAEEKKLTKLVPVPVPGVMGTSSYFGDYYEKVLGKEKLASFNLNPNFAYGVIGYTEAHNFIDGTRSILEIYQATQAELWSEGYPASHDITLAEVENYMRMLEAAKVITIEKRD